MQSAYNKNACIELGYVKQNVHKDHKRFEEIGSDHFLALQHAPW